MGLTYKEISLRDVAKERNIRIDQELYIAQEKFNEFIAQFDKVKPLGSFLIALRNGVDYKASFYSQSSNTGILYLSVNQISSGFGHYLNLTDAKFLEIDLKDLEVVVSLGDVVLTRSGTPGIAWAATEDVLSQWDAVVPSGYTHLLTVDTSEMNPQFLATYLNSPPVRMLTKAAASGKDQPNLAQDYIKAIPVPIIPEENQLAIVEKIDHIYEKASQARRLAEGLRLYGDWQVISYLMGENTQNENLPAIPDNLPATKSMEKYETEWMLPARRESD